MSIPTATDRLLDDVDAWHATITTRLRTWRWGDRKRRNAASVLQALEEYERAVRRVLDES